MNRLSVYELKSLLESSSSSDPQYADLLFYLGKSYNQGLNGAHIDIPQAIALYQKAAALDHTQAIYHLALCYDLGMGPLEVDHDKAIEYYTIAAERGILTAQHNLATHYMEGNGTDKDISKAMYWYEKAANAGSKHSQNNLGAYYGEGKVVSLDYEKSFHYYRLAAEQGVGTAQYRIGTYYANGYGCSKDMKEAMKWYHLAADEGNDASAQHTLGLSYDVGVPNENASADNIVEIDKDKAVYYYFLAAQQGFPLAQLNLGVHLDSGEGIDGGKPDPHAATFWYYQAGIQGGNADALLYLGHHFSDGRGVEKKDMTQAVAFYSLAAQKGKVEAQAMLAWCYSVGEGVEKVDMEQSFAWYYTAAQQDFPPAEYQVARMYEEGLGQPDNKKDLIEAIHWYRKARDHAFPPACYSLGRLIALYDQEDGDTCESEEDGEEKRQVKATNNKKERFEIARKEFRECIRLGNDVGYVGLATVAESEQEAIEYLVIAADKGNVEAWFHLSSYPQFAENDYLRRHWDSEKLAALIELSKAATNTTSPNDVNTEEHTDNHQSLLIHDPTCPICQRDISTTLYASTLTGKSQIPPFRNHILPQAFLCSHSSPTINTDEDNQHHIPLLDILDSGGFGDVFKAKCRADILQSIRNLASSDDKEDSLLQVALKRIRTSDSLFQGNMMRDEMIKMKLLQRCPYIVQCYGHCLLESQVASSRNNHNGSLKDSRDYESSDEDSVEESVRQQDDGKSMNRISTETDIQGDQSFYLVMELAEYGDLNDILDLMANSQCLNGEHEDEDGDSSIVLTTFLPLMVKWMLQIASGLKFMHRYFLKHLDIKPKNVLVFRHLDVKLTDFGISAKEEDHILKMIRMTNVTSDLPFPAHQHENQSRSANNGNRNDEDDEDTTIDSRSNGDSYNSSSSGNSYTGSSFDSSLGTETSSRDCRTDVTHTVAGTPGYMDPLMSDVGKRLESDIFSFAMTCVHIINQKKPLQSMWQRDLRYAMSELNSICPDLKHLLSACASMNIKDRPTAEECCQRLSAILESLPPMDDEVLKVFEEEVRTSVYC